MRAVMRIESLIKQYENNYKQVRAYQFVYIGLHAVISIIGVLLLLSKAFSINLNWFYIILLSTLGLLGMGFLGWLLPIKTHLVIAQADRSLGYEAKLITLYQLVKEESHNVFQKLLYDNVVNHAEQFQNKQAFQFSIKHYSKISFAVGLVVFTLVLAWALWPSGVLEDNYTALTQSVGEYEEQQLDFTQELFRETLVRSSSQPNLIDMEAVEFQWQTFPNDFGEDSEKLDELKQRLVMEMAASQEVLRRRLDLSEDAAKSMQAAADSQNQTGLKGDSGGISHEQSSSRNLDYSKAFLQQGLLVEDEALMEELMNGVLMGGDFVEIDDDFQTMLPGSAGVSPDEVVSDDSAEYQYSGEDYQQQRLSSAVTDDSYITAYLDELLPPLPGVQDRDQPIERRFVSYRTDLLNQLANEEIPAVYRDLIREYFSLLALE